MSDGMGGNKVGKYEIVRNRRGEPQAGGRRYYQTYLPADLGQADESLFQTEGLSDALHAIYREIGVQQGLCFYEDNLPGKTSLLYKQETAALLKRRNSASALEDIFSLRMSETVSARMDLYNALEQRGKAVRESALLEDILLGTVRAQGHSKFYHGKFYHAYPFRKSQIWEEESARKISLREHNPPMPERIPDLMMRLDMYRRTEDRMDVMVLAALLCYQFLAVMPYQEYNEIWAGILLNLFLKSKGCGLSYYVPFAKALLKEEKERRESMRRVREEASYGPWIVFCLKIMERAIADTNRLIMQLAQIRRETAIAISGEKQKVLLGKILPFMEEYPIFIIGDIEEQFDVAYNTAAKAVSTLEKRGIVREISRQQRYRVYCYDKYIRELGELKRK